MFFPLLTKVRDQIETIKGAIATHAALRELVRAAQAASVAPDKQLESLVKLAPNALAWKIYDHCAGFTRLYAVYDTFIKSLVGEWLEEQPKLHATFGDLPDNVRRAYRSGIGDLLIKCGGDRYGYLTELSVIQGLFAGLTGKPYSLLSDAFFVGDQNLRVDELEKVLANVGIQNTKAWINNYPEMEKFLAEVRGGQASWESELKSLIKYRNLAAHEGEVTDLVAPDDFSKYAEFTACLCNAIHDLVSHNVIRLRIANGTACKIGIVVKRFSGNIVGAECPEAPLAPGDSLFVFRPKACYRVTIQSIQIDSVPKDTVAALGATLVGLKLTQGATEGSELIRLLSTPTVGVQVSIPGSEDNATGTSLVIATSVSTPSDPQPAPIPIALASDPSPSPPADQSAPPDASVSAPAGPSGAH